MKSSFKLGRMAGLKIGVHYTWLWAFLLVTWSLAASYFPDATPSLGREIYWRLGIFAVLALFASVLTHEMMYSFNAHIIVRQAGV